MSEPILISGSHNQDVIGCDTVAEVVPDWVLVRCHTANHMVVGQYGLYQRTGGSPYDQEVEFKFATGTVFLDRGGNLSDQELNERNEMALDEKFWPSLEKEFEPVMRCGLETGYHLYRACLAAGYDPQTHGSRITYWLSNRIGEIIRRTDAEAAAHGSSKG